MKWIKINYQHNPFNLPYDGKFYRFSYHFGRERILKYISGNKFVNFEGDCDHDIEFGIGNPTHYQPYKAPKEIK